MSYILDALQRANAERERGAVPGLHAQPLPTPDAQRSLPAPAQLVIWVVAAVGAVALGALAVQLARPAPPPNPAQAASATASVSVAPPPVQSPDTAKPVSQPSAAIATTAVSAPAVSQEALAAANAALRSSPAAAAVAKPAASAARAEASAPVRTTASAPTVVAKNDRIYALSELPEDVRAQLPAVTISGASYSENAAQRLLIVNGNVVQERGTVAPEVVLEQIGERSAVLRFKDYRYRIGY